MSRAADIKNEIKTSILDALVTAQVLKEVQVDDFSKKLTDRDFTQWPAAILTSPQIDSGYDTNASNMRTYTFVILVLVRAENVESATEIEDLMEAILDKIDQTYTLAGDAEGGVEPSISSPGPVTAGNKSCIGFTVTLRAKASNAFR